MNSFYYVRHGQTRANLEKFMSGGEWDLPLTAGGEDQAEQLASYLANNPIQAKTLCVSPMLRAQKTAEIINRVLKIPIITVENLREWRVGAWEGQPWETVLPRYFSDENPPQGESRQELGTRALNALNETQKYSSVIIVGHGIVWDQFSSHLNLGIRRVNNCSLHFIEGPGSYKCLYPGH